MFASHLGSAFLLNSIKRKCMSTQAPGSIWAHPPGGQTSLTLPWNDPIVGSRKSELNTCSSCLPGVCRVPSRQTLKRAWWWSLFVSFCPTGWTVSSLHFLLDPAPGGIVARAERHAHWQNILEGAWRCPQLLSIEELDYLQEPNSWTMGNSKGWGTPHGRHSGDSWGQGR